jgi:hypothetical protein
MIPLWKGKNPIYFGVIRSKVKVTYYRYNFCQQGHFRTITLVLYIGSLTNLGTWFPCGRGKNPIYFGVIRSKVKVTVTINIIFDKQDRFRTITLVLYIGSLPNLAIWFPSGRGRTLFIPPANKVWGVYRNHPVRPSMYLVSTTLPKRLIGFLWNFTHL